MTSIREMTRSLDATIVEDYYENGVSHNELRKKYGRSPSSIAKILKADELRNGPRERKVAPVDPRKAIRRPPISGVHAYIGTQVGRFMTEKNISPTFFGQMGDVAMSRVMVGKVVAGTYDELSISQVQAISEVIGVPYEELVRGR